MSSRRSRTWLRGFLALLGTTALSAGTGTMLFGVDSIVGAEEVSATVDSEMRFFATWYAAAGAVLLWAACNLRRARLVVLGVAVALFAAGSSRALSWVMVGEPHVVARVLMVIELVLPLVIVRWYTFVDGSGKDNGMRTEED